MGKSAERFSVVVDRNVVIPDNERRITVRHIIARVSETKDEQPGLIHERNRNKFQYRLPGWLGPGQPWGSLRRFSSQIVRSSSTALPTTPLAWTALGFAC